MKAYYNEFDPKSAAWLKELIAKKLITKGDVDERSITEVQGSDVEGYDRVHFFAGIGGWDHALNLAGLKEKAWTGSCPCQPFSTGGNGLAEEDARHLWPEFYRIISQVHPPRVFGEQVASKAGDKWLDGVWSDMEAKDYSFGACVLGAHSKALPHPRQRFYWSAYSNCELHSGKIVPQERRQGAIPSIWESEKILQAGQGGINELVSRRIAQRVSSYSKAMSLLDGIPSHMALLRGGGNAIVPQVAAEFILCSEEACYALVN